MNFDDLQTDAKHLCDLFACWPQLTIGPTKRSGARQR